MWKSPTVFFQKPAEEATGTTRMEGHERTTGEEVKRFTELVLKLERRLGVNVSAGRRRPGLGRQAVLEAP